SCREFLDARLRIQLAGVESHAHDRGADTDVTQLAEIRDAVHSARRLKRELRPKSDLLHEPQVRTFHATLSLDGSDENPSERQRTDLLDEVDDVHRTGLRPTPGHELPRSGVRGDHKPVRIA